MLGYSNKDISKFNGATNYEVPFSLTYQSRDEQLKFYSESFSTLSRDPDSFSLVPQPCHIYNPASKKKRERGAYYLHSNE